MVLAIAVFACSTLVAALAVPIVGGLLWKRGTRALATMAEAAVHRVLAAGLAAHVVVSLATARTDAVLQRWRERLAGASGETEEAGRRYA